MRADRNNKRANRIRPTSSVQGASNRANRGGISCGAFQQFATTDATSKFARKTLEEAIEQLSALQKEQLARQLGYDSFNSVLASSTVVTLSDGSAWWLTSDRYGRWAAWNFCAIDLPLRPMGGAATSHLTDQADGF